jgi:peptidoglycan/LPS O-acetylase OafA/YrhL
MLWLLLRPAPQFFDHLTALTGWLRYRYLLVVTILVALAAFTRNGEPGRLGKVLSRLGDWSFGLYLLLPFTMKLVAPHVSGRLGFSLSLGLAILAAAVVHRWIEEPAGRLAKR